jgi:hypothetical protein
MSVETERPRQGKLQALKLNDESLAPVGGTGWVNLVRNADRDSVGLVDDQRKRSCLYVPERSYNRPTANA